MRPFANTSLDSCRDIADEVWDEFMRQSITEIYQAQQDKIRTVKNECLDVVNNCYDTQSQSLKDFSNIKEQLLLGQRLELSEQLCTEKLAACSNLYGGGTSGLNELIKTMTDINDAKIAKECLTTLREFAQDICAVPSNDTLHSYPYSCRFYNPGSQQYAHLRQCNISDKKDTESDITDYIFDIDKYKQCKIKDKIYTKCNNGYCLQDKKCVPGTKIENNELCISQTEQSQLDCKDYTGSLYQRIVRYAMEVCIRPSHTGEIPTEILQDANVVMDSIRVDMGKELAKQCESLGGQWVDTKWINNDSDTDIYDKHDITGDLLHTPFYNETGANTEWRYCKPLTTE